MNEELKALLSIAMTCIVQGSYDYLGWDVILGSKDDGRTAEKVYRVIKEILDIPVTALVMLFWLHLAWYDILWFFLIKVTHGCDRWYNQIDIWQGKDPSFWGYWRWWTMPFGWIRTDWFGKGAFEEGYTFKDYIQGTGHFEKGGGEERLAFLQKMYGSPLKGADPKTYDTFKYRRGMVNIEEVNFVNNIAWICCISFYFIKLVWGLALI